jgi:ubiquinone/menaquinone biosynthesis C-methylase UbiE
MADISEADTVLDLGSGPGFDCFLAAKKVGKKGRVIGVDISSEMIDLASKNKQKYGFNNVEFKLGEIEDLPIKSKSIDVVISNCVVNLSPEKSKVFEEAGRVLKPGGRLYLSDIVLLKELTDKQRADKELLAGCVGGALLINEYIGKIKEAGFEVKILAEDKEISKRQYQGIDLESIKIEATKG